MDLNLVLDTAPQEIVFAAREPAWLAVIVGEGDRIVLYEAVDP